MNRLQKRVDGTNVCRRRRRRRRGRRGRGRGRGGRGGKKKKKEWMKRQEGKDAKRERRKEEAVEITLLPKTQPKVRGYIITKNQLTLYFC